MWIFYSVIAAVLWGLDYALTGKVLERVRFSTLLSIELFFGFIVMLALALAFGGYKQELLKLLSSKDILIYTVLIVILFNVANSFIVLAIGSSNATVAGLIEVSYPIFIALFSWLIFKESYLNLGSVIGGILILAGVALVTSFGK